jgi:hypothetical protein
MFNPQFFLRSLSLMGLSLALGSTVALATGDLIELNISPKGGAKETVQLTDTRSEVFNQSGWVCSAMKPKANAGITICNNGPAEVALTVDCSQPRMTFQSIVLASSEGHQMVSTLVLACMTASE